MTDNLIPSNPFSFLSVLCRVHCRLNGRFVLGSRAGAGCVLGDVGMEFLYTIWLNASLERVQLNSVNTVCRPCIWQNVFS